MSTIDKNKKKKRQTKTGISSTTSEFISFSAFATSPTNTNNFIPSPIYTPTLQDTTLIAKIQTIFKKILKRDATTKCRALQQLRNEIEELPKKEIVGITSYLFYIFETRLSIDNSRHVRYEILTTFNMVQDIIPKAFSGFISSSYKIIGLLYIMTCDTANEVKNEALTIVQNTS